MPAIKLFAGMARSYRCLAKSFSDKFSIGFPDFNYSLRLCAAANTPRKRRRLSVIPFISFCDNWAKARSMCARCAGKMRANNFSP